MGAAVACGLAGTVVARGTTVDLGAEVGLVSPLRPGASVGLAECGEEAGMPLRDGAPDGATGTPRSGTRACTITATTFWAALLTSGIAAAAAVAPSPSDAATASVMIIALRCPDRTRARCTLAAGAISASTSGDGAGASPAPSTSMSLRSAWRRASSSMPDCVSSSSMCTLVMMCSRRSSSVWCEGWSALGAGVA